MMTIKIGFEGDWDVGMTDEQRDLKKDLVTAAMTRHIEWKDDILRQAINRALQQSYSFDEIRRSETVRAELKSRVSCELVSGLEKFYVDGECIAVFHRPTYPQIENAITVAIKYWVKP